MKNLIMVILVVIVVFGIKLNAQNYSADSLRLLELEKRVLKEAEMLYNKLNTFETSISDVRNNIIIKVKVDSTRLRPARSLDVIVNNELIIVIIANIGLYSISFKDNPIFFNLFNEFKDFNFSVQFYSPTMKDFLISSYQNKLICCDRNQVKPKSIVNLILHSELECEDCDRMDLMKQYEEFLNETSAIIATIQRVEN